MADDYKVRNYQDELDNDDDQADLVTQEETDDLADRAGVPPNVLKEEFDGMDSGDSPLGTQDDIREEIEDEDENMGRPGRF